MKIIAPKKLKTRFYLAVTLILILSVLSVGTYLSEKIAVESVSGNLNDKTVIIDAGHGGFDGGTSASDGTVEKDLNLKIALKVNDFLCSMGVNTIMTRTDDSGTNDESASTIRQKKISDIKNRLKIIESNPDAIFVSIHQNHFSQSKYSGAQVFYSKNNPLSVKLAESIRYNIITVLQKDNSREIKQSGSEIYLLHNSAIPSIMIECGFLSNKEETEKLKDENYQRKLAFTIAMGIVDYFNQSED